MLKSYIAEELDPSLGHIRSLRGLSEIGMKFPPFRVVYKKEVSMACEDVDAKVKGKLPGVGSADRRESCWLTRKECPLSFSMALANPAPFLLYIIYIYSICIYFLLYYYSTYVCLPPMEPFFLDNFLPRLLSPNPTSFL